MYSEISKEENEWILKGLKINTGFGHYVWTIVGFKHISLVTDDGLYDRKALYKMKSNFFTVHGWVQ